MVSQLFVMQLGLDCLVNSSSWCLTLILFFIIIFFLSSVGVLKVHLTLGIYSTFQLKLKYCDIHGKLHWEVHLFLLVSSFNRNIFLKIQQHWKIMISLVYELEIYVPVLRMKLANSHGFICGGSVCIYIDLRAEFDHVKSNATDMWAFFFCYTCEK